MVGFSGWLGGDPRVAPLRPLGLIALWDRAPDPARDPPQASSGFYLGDQPPPPRESFGGIPRRGLKYCLARRARYPNRKVRSRTSTPPASAWISTSRQTFLMIPIQLRSRFQIGSNIMVSESVLFLRSKIQILSGGRPRCSVGTPWGSPWRVVMVGLPKWLWGRSSEGSIGDPPEFIALWGLAPDPA